MIVDVEVRHTARFEFEVFAKPENPLLYWARCTNRGGHHVVVGPAPGPLTLAQMVECRLKEEFERLEEWVNFPALRKSIQASAGNIPTNPPVK